MFERLTEEAREVVVLAQDEARSLRHNYIGTEHLLLGMLREGEGLAAALLEEAGVTIERARDEVARIVGIGDEVTSGQIPFTPRAKKMLELSVREALSRDHHFVGTEHLLLGLLREGEGVAVRVLMDLGVDPDELHQELLRRMEPGTAEQVDDDARRRRRLEILDAYLAAAARREEVARVVGDAADADAAALALQELLNVSPEQARAVAGLRLARLARDEVARIKAERDELVG